MSIVKPGNYVEIMTYSRQHPSQLVVVDCKATWCGPCKVLHPQLVKLAASRPDVQFMEIDVDDPGHEDTVSSFKITAMPTILYLAGGKEVVERTVGANLADIQSKVAQATGR